MCGIIGVFGASGVEKAASLGYAFSNLPGTPHSDENQHPEVEMLRVMMDKIEHRGPDGQGLFSNQKSNVALAHCRLAIMDPLGGAQPLYNEDNDMVLVSNGEIYNFRALRQDLTGGHQFYTNTDNETILHLVEEHGPAAIQTLDGMYAFALYHANGFMLARDPIGIKPLYYGLPKVAADVHQDDEFSRRIANGDAPLYFASELKAFANTNLTVREFPPGTYYDSQQGFVTYYTVPEQQPVAATIDTVAGELRKQVEAAVTKRLMSDVPLGAFLSINLDSSLIAAIVRQHVDTLHTFSVGIEGSNDIEAARVVADHIRLDPS
ncbi:MAG: asparagine synthase-related protein [Caldilineaceae bacterium]